MRRLVSVVLVSAITLSPCPAFAARGRVAQSQGASISGKVTTAAGQLMANVTQQLRDLATGQLAGTTTSSASGAFSFSGIPAGTYVIELVDATGKIVGTTAPIVVTPGATITGITLTASAAAAAAGATAGAVGGGIGTATTVAAVAAAAGIAGLVAATTRNTASPSQ